MRDTHVRSTRTVHQCAVLHIKTSAARQQFDLTSIMTYRVWTFILTSLQTGRPVAFAAICEPARYVSALFIGATRMDRPFATPVQWKEVKYELSVGVNPGPLPSDGTLFRLLAGERDVSVQYVHHQAIDVPDPAQAVAVLDGHLRAQMPDTADR